MSIKRTQEAIAEQKILTQKLKEGMYPSVTLLSQLVESAFVDRIAGLPRFSFEEIDKGTVSNAESYNALFSSIGEDLQVGFEEVKYLNNRIMSLSQYYEANRTQIDKNLNQIEARIQNMSKQATATTNMDIIGDNLNNFTMIDFIGDEQRNIPKTDVFMNLKQSEAEMHRLRNSTIKHDISQAKVYFEADGNLDVLNISPLDSALQDTIFDAWQSIVVNDESGTVSATLTLELSEPVYATSISFDSQVGKPIYATLLVSEDGKDFSTYERRKIISSYQWVFNRRKISVVKFKLEKKEEDRPNGSDFEYLFGAKNVQVLEDRYAQQSHFVSKAFELPYHDAVEKISLDVDESVPANTNIRYYVGFDYDTNVIEWEEVQKDRPFLTDMVHSYKMDINRYSLGYGDLLYRKFGQQFHRIVKLPHKPMKKTLKLMLGKNMWLRETIDAPFEHVDDPSPVYQTGVKDWVRIGTPRKDYLRVQNRYDYLQQDVFHRYTTYVQMDEASSFTATIASSEQASHAVFLNGNEVKGVSQTYAFSFTAGWNKIEVYAYSQGETEELTLDFYIPKLNGRIFASKEPLQQVSLYDMLHNTSARLHGRFAVDDENNIIVNYHPRDMDIQYQLRQPKDETDKERIEAKFADGVEYSLSYKYSSSDETKHKLRFMAILSKEQDEIETTPRLQNYALQIE